MAHKAMTIPLKIIMAFATFAADYLVRIRGEDVKLRPCNMGGTGGPFSARESKVLTPWGIAANCHGV
jgi:hypothetical protein